MADKNTIKDEFDKLQDGLRGIKANPGEGAGYAFHGKNTKLARLVDRKNSARVQLLNDDAKKEAGDAQND